MRPHGTCEVYRELSGRDSKRIAVNLDMDMKLGADEIAYYDVSCEVR